MWAIPRTSWPAREQRRPEGEDRPGVDPRRCQQHLAERREGVLRLRADGGRRRVGAERPRQLFLVRPLERQVPAGEQAPDEREAVRVEPGRRQPDDRVVRLRGRPVEQQVPLDDADARAREVERGRIHQARVLRRLAAKERGSPPAGSPRPRPRRAPRPGADPAGRRRCSRGRTAARRRRRPRRRRTSRRGPSRSCRSARAPPQSPSSSPRRRSRPTSTGSR